MTRLPLSFLFIAATTLPVFATEFVVQDGASQGQVTDNVTALSPEVGDDLSLHACCCDCCCPSWTGRVGYVHLWRERTGSDFAVWEGAVTPIPLYTADRFDFDAASGLEVSIFRDNGCGQGWEVRYFGLEDFVASETTAFGVTSRLATNPDTSLNFTTATLNFRQESELQSFQLLRAECCGGVRLSYGFRYVDLDETLTITRQADGDNYQFQAHNRLYGFETGLDSILWDNGCRLKLQGSARAGLYYNDVEASASSTFAGARSGQAASDEAAFIGELGLNAGYDVNCQLSLRAGYQLLFVDGVALAADQVPNSGGLGNANPNPVPVNIDSSSLLYHGFNIGLEYRR